ncbi:MAG: transcriptional activator RfaH [Rhodospirillales bacterium]|nr:transcriptional activator RfaH [Rhodospirillales bacterium]
MKRWYVVHTQPQAERRAHANLVRQGFETYLPCYLKRRSHARKIERVPAPLFPRYLFVGIDPQTMRWRSIYSTFGVSHLISNGDMPAPVPEGVVEAIRARHGHDGLVRLDDPIPFKKGDRVEITQGSLRDLSGLFQCESDDDRVFVLLELMGRPVRVRVPLAAIRACA